MTRRIRVQFLSICVVACAAVSGSAQPTGYEGFQIVRVEVTDQSDIEALRALFETDSGIWLKSEVLMVGDVDVRVAPGSMGLLDAAGLCADVVIEDLQAHIDGLYSKARGGGFFDSLATYDEHVQFMQDLVAAHPAIAEMLSIGMSVEGRTIWALRITGSGTSKDGVFFHGAQHGDEQAGASMVAFMADHLVTQYETDPEVARLVDGLEWFLVPIMNPDGYEAFYRVNANFVDLNRNWGGPGSNIELDGGPYPFSEPETDAMRQLLLAHPSIRLHVDIHGYVPWFMWPWGNTTQLSKDDATFRLLGERFRETLAIETGQVYDIGTVSDVAYFIFGGSVDYSYGDLGRWSFAFEISGGGYAGYLPSCLGLARWILDCNVNGVADSEDLQDGTSSDCNGNQTPDECERPDCNGNGRLDECERIEGSAYDVDGNHLLDECEADCAITPEWVKLVAADGAASDQFGSAVDLDGDVIVVGAWGDDGEGLDNGSAYIFGKSEESWIQKQKLIADDAAILSQHKFGKSVAVSGEMAIVGARGAAYVFRLVGDAWQQVDKFVGTEASFGQSVDIWGNVAVVGEPTAELASDSSLGKVHVFRFDGVDWQLEDTFSPVSEIDIVEFGHVVSISGDKIHVAAVHDLCYGEPRSEAPVSYVYQFDEIAWAEAGRHEPFMDPECQVKDLDISISGNIAVLGSPRARNYQFHHGTAFVFGFDGVNWTEQAQLLNYEPGHTAFGTSVAADAGTVIISDQSGSNLFVYRSNGQAWLEKIRLSLPPATAKRGGGRIALDDGTLVVGVSLEPGAEPETGAVYVFDGLNTDENQNGRFDFCEDCNDNDVLDDADISGGFSQDCNGDGSPDECTPDCNDNGESDECDIFFGVSIDCNLNLIPDECERDCNRNGFVDACDIEDGFSADADGNGVPDECGPSCVVAETQVLDVGWGSVAVLGDTALVGVAEEDLVYVLRREGTRWVIAAELSDAGGDDGNDFGSAVVLGDGVAFVGAPRDNTSEFALGAVYVFQYDGAKWAQVAKLFASNTADSFFGLTLAQNGNALVIGAGYYGSSVGAVYVFGYDGAQWVEEQRLRPSGATRYQRFGRSVVLAQGGILVGSRTGVYEFQFDGLAWVEHGKLTVSGGTEYGSIGASLSASANRILVGASGDPRIVNSGGVAYIFRRINGAWTEEAKLTASDGARGDLFGNDVALSGDWALIGAHKTDRDAPKAGSAYLYHFDGSEWVEEMRLGPSDSTPGQRFGTRLALDNGNAMISSGYAVTHTYSYHGLMSDCDGNGICDACEEVAFGDSDSDGTLGLSDFAAMELCLAGPVSPPNPPVAECAYECLAVFDANDDRHVDLADVASFMRLLE